MRLFDINEYRLLFRCEIYVNMHENYRILRANFHCVPLPKMVLGIEYSNEQDSLFFKLFIERYCPKMEFNSQHTYSRNEHNFKIAKNEY